LNSPYLTQIRRAFGDFCKIGNLAKRQFNGFIFLASVENSIHDFTKILPFDDEQFIAQGRDFHIAIGERQMRISKVN